MKKKKVINELKRFFKIQELVCDHTFARDNEKAWRYLDVRWLHTLLVLRTEILCVPLVINTSKAKQRGLRCNLCPLVKDKKTLYLSAHIFGKGGDIISSQMGAEEMRQKIERNKDKLPYPVRIERDVDWLHIDVMNDTNEKIIYF